jgi:hypothetical protein
MEPEALVKLPDWLKAMAIIQTILGIDWRAACSSMVCGRSRLLSGVGR